jgi:hypothetical protein
MTDKEIRELMRLKLIEMAQCPNTDKPGEITAAFEKVTGEKVKKCVAFRDADLREAGNIFCMNSLVVYY